MRFFSWNFTLYFIGTFIITAIYYLTLTTMARYAILTYACSQSIAGLTASIFLAGGVLGRCTAGYYSNRWDSKRAILFSAVLTTFTCALYVALHLPLWALIVIRVVHGFAFGIGGTFLTSLAIAALPQESIGEGTGVYMLSVTMGVGIGPMMGLLIGNDLNYTAMFIVCLALSFVYLTSVLLLRHERTLSSSNSQPEKQSFSWQAILDPKTLRFGIFMFLVAAAYSSLGSFLDAFSSSLDLTNVVPFTFLIYAVVNLASRPIFGKLLDRRGDNIVMIPCISCMVIGLLICSLAQGALTILLVGVFMALGFATPMSLGQAIVAREASNENATRAMSTFLILNDAGCAIGPYALGFACTVFGYRGMYIAAAGVAILSLLYYFFEHGKNCQNK